MFQFTINNAQWSCDNDGHEVGYPDRNVVGTFTFEAGDGCGYTVLVDSGTNEILEIHRDEDCEEEIEVKKPPYADLDD